MELGLQHYVTVIYIAMLVIFYCQAYQRLARSNRYRAVSALVVDILWPVAAGILIVMYVEALLETIRDIICKKDYE